MFKPQCLADLRLAQKGDRQAMDRLLAILRPYLQELARRHTVPGCATESTADLVQEAALRLWQRLPQFQGGPDDEQTAAMFHDWLSQLVRHLALDKQRQRHAQRREPPHGRLPLDAPGSGESGDEQGGLDPASSGPSPSTNVQAHEQARLIREALARIPADQDREIVRLSFFEGLSLRDIARRLNLSYDKVRERYHCTLRRLEHELKGLL
jgi:RNA polymerase sigma factor (sigma-70 family)